MQYPSHRMISDIERQGKSTEFIGHTLQKSLAISS